MFVFTITNILICQAQRVRNIVPVRDPAVYTYDTLIEMHSIHVPNQMDHDLKEI